MRNCFWCYFRQVLKLLENAKLEDRNVLKIIWYKAFDHWQLKFPDFLSVRLKLASSIKKDGDWYLVCYIYIYPQFLAQGQSLFTLFKYKRKVRQKKNYRKRNDED